MGRRGRKENKRKGIKESRKPKIAIRKVYKGIQVHVKENGRKSEDGKIAKRGREENKGRG